MSAGSESHRGKRCAGSFKKNIGWRKKEGKLQLTAIIYFHYVLEDVYKKFLALQKFC